MEPLISLENISRVYPSGDGELYALKEVSLSVEQGEYVAIVGSSGSGKSTLMNILGCLDTPDSGIYLIAGENSSDFTEQQLSHLRNKRIGFVFQSFNLIPTLTALENVELPLIYRKVKAKERSEMALQALERVGLSERTGHYPSQLSGGQQQRVAIARAIAASPDIILADEPTGNLDRASATAVTEILSELHRQGKTIVLITHDKEVAAMAQRIVCIKDGMIEA